MERSHEMKRSLPALFIAAMAVALTGETIAQSDTSTVLPSGKVQRSISASATVEAIDLEKRIVVLRRENGTTVTVQVDERVKNLPQVRVGDRVQVNYREAVAFQVKPAGETTPSVSMKEGLTTARPGEKPAGVGTQEVTIVATIDAINREKPSVSLRTAHGEVTEVQVRDPNNLKRVKVGDQVEVTYSTALALSVVAIPSAASGSSAPAARSKTPGATKDLNRKELDRIRAAN
jgi:Cu/Ag efflux protein CusF